MKGIYLASWVLFAIFLITAALTDSFSSLHLVGFSFAALILVYAFALWLAFTNTGIPESVNSDQG